MAACDNSVILFISDDDNVPLSIIFKLHIEEEEMEEPHYLGNIIMSPGKLSLIKVVTKDYLILCQHFSEKNMTIFQSPKHTPFFYPHYKDIQDKNMYLRQTHCKYKLLPSILYSSINENKHLQCEHYKYKLSPSILFIIASTFPYWCDPEHFIIQLNPSFDLEALILLESISLMMLRCYSLLPQHLRITETMILLMYTFSLDTFCDFVCSSNCCPSLFLQPMGSWCWCFDW